MLCGSPGPERRAPLGSGGCQGDIWLEVRRIGVGGVTSVASPEGHHPSRT